MEGYAWLDAQSMQRRHTQANVAQENYHSEIYLLTSHKRSQHDQRRRCEVGAYGAKYSKRISEVVNLSYCNGVWNAIEVGKPSRQTYSFLYTSCSASYITASFLTRSRGGNTYFCAHNGNNSQMKPSSGTCTVRSLSKEA